MRNGVSLLKQYARRPLLSSIYRGWIVVAAWLLVGSGQPAAAPQASRGVTPPGAPAPALARLFTPLQAPSDAYVVTVLPQGIEAALATVKSTLASAAVAGNPEGSWQVREASPLEAFGTAGTYDRGKVARLYGGRRASLVRGPVERDGRVVAGVTLISPYPDATLSRLEPGTLLIVVRVDGRIE